MNSEQSNDVIDAAAYSVDELREAVFEGRARLARPLALALLTRKEYPEKLTDLERILSDESEQPRLRAMAAAALGDMDTPGALRALERGLRSKGSVALRAIVKSLGKLGTRKHMIALEELARRPDPLGREAQRAATVIAGRLKTRRTDAPLSIRTVPLDGAAETVAIRVQTAAPKDVAQAAKSVPSSKLARTNAVSMKCEGRHLVFLFDEASLGAGLDLLKRRGVIGVVAEQRQVEGTGWEHRYFVSVEPEGKGRFKVLVTTHDGRPVFAGSGTTTANGATFDLAAVDRPGALPVEIRGRFDGRRLTIEDANSASHRHPARLPTGDKHVVG